MKYANFAKNFIKNCKNKLMLFPLGSREIRFALKEKVRFCIEIMLDCERKE